jgi:hypothetical protein
VEKISGFRGAGLWSGLLLVSALTTSAAAQERRSAIRGTVVTAGAGTPIAGVRVALVGAGRAAVTDSLGRFVFDSLRAGTYLVHARGDQDETPMLEVPLAAREVVDLDVQLGKTDAVLLPELAVTAPDEAPGAIDAMRLPAEFKARQRNGLGQFLTREQIQERNPYTVADIFRGLRGIVVACRNGFCLPRAARGNCSPLVVVDRVATDVSVLSGMVPGDLEAIEVYNGMSSAPSEYLRPSVRSTCGMIIVWTRVPPQKRPNQ